MRRLVDVSLLLGVVTVGVAGFWAGVVALAAILVLRHAA